MGKKKKDEDVLPEVAQLMEGMQELICDEHGNPLTPDHPQYKKFAGLIENITNLAVRRNQENPSAGPKGTA